MHVLVTGGTGFVGRALCPRLAADGHEVSVLTRSPGGRAVSGAERVVGSLERVDPGAVDAVVNLAGEPIGDGRWTEARRKLLLESRTHTTVRLVEWMRGARRPPRVLVSASAVGYYGEQGDRPVTEETPPAPGFTHDLCAAWEREAVRAEEFGVRVCRMRIGVVLDRDGGALAKMLPAFRLGVGGRLGSGRHYFPWIHRTDMAAICQWLIESPDARGAYNCSAPNPVTNAEFTQALGRALGRPTWLPVPETALKLLLGDLSELLLVSDRMLPRRLLEAGFVFRHPRLRRRPVSMHRATHPRGPATVAGLRSRVGRWRREAGDAIQRRRARALRGVWRNPARS